MTNYSGFLREWDDKKGLYLYQFPNVKHFRLTKKEKAKWEEICTNYVNEFIKEAYNTPIPFIEVKVNGRNRKTQGSFVSWQVSLQEGAEVKKEIEISGKVIRTVDLFMHTGLAVADEAVSLLEDILRHEAIHYVLFYLQLTALKGDYKPQYNDGTTDFERDLFLTGTSSSGSTRPEYKYDTGGSTSDLAIAYTAKCPSCGASTVTHKKVLYWCPNHSTSPESCQSTLDNSLGVSVYITHSDVRGKLVVKEDESYEGDLILPHKREVSIKNWIN